jgi:hypothetical protein
MIDWIESGRIADIILAVMLLEGLLLTLWYRQTGGGIAPFILMWRLLAGMALVLALRAALTEAGATWIIVCLLLSLVAHALDLYCSWSRSGKTKAPALPTSADAERG